MADDFTLLEFVKIHESISNIAPSPSPWGFTTPLPNAFIWIVFGVSAMNSGGYYAFNLFLHTINTILVFELVRLVASHRGLAFSAAAIFLLHFAHFSDWGAAVWISAFNQLIVALFYLGSLVLFVGCVHYHKMLCCVSSLICFALALASKETSISLPILLLAWCLIGFRSSQKRTIHGIAMLTPFFLLLAMYLIYEISFQSSGHYLQGGLYGVGPHMLTNWKYFSNLVMPNPTSPPVQSYLLRAFPPWVLTAAQYMTWIARAVLLLLATILFWKGPNRIRLWIAWAIITYLPFLGFTEGFAGPNRYFYLPAVGFSALLAEGLLWAYGYLRRHLNLRTAKAILVVAVLVIWGYNLVPIRVWQKQMIANSAIRREALGLVGDRLSKGTVSKVYLQGFPDKFADLRTAIHVFYDLDAEWLDATVEESLQPLSSTLILRYDDGRIITH